MTAKTTDRILILDFGSQVTQLIARRVRENGVYCEIQPYTASEEKIRAFAPRGIIMSGGRASPAAVPTDERRFYGVVFHPEVVHTPQGGKLLRNFTHHVAGCRGDWTMAAFRAQAIDRIRDQVQGGRGACGLSGG